MKYDRKDILCAEKKKKWHISRLFNMVFQSEEIVQKMQKQSTGLCHKTIPLEKEIL